MKIAVIVLSVAVVPFIAACDLQDLINPGAASREAYEHRQSILMQPVKETPKAMHVEPDVYSEPTKPVCIVTYRISRCDENGNTVDWYYL